MHDAARLALEAVRRRATAGVIEALGVDIHLQPDALTPEGRGVLERIGDTGVWRTQFETGTSNGGLTAVPGGDRVRWESRLFDGAYDRCPPQERPAYGGLRRGADAYGAAPRFGSAFLRLRPGVLGRTTLCYPDSVFEPSAFGTVDQAGTILAALHTVHLDDPLDRYVEAHVHGGIRFDADVATVVLDPSFRSTAIEHDAERLASIEWHPGYLLHTRDLPATEAYRGRAVTDAARRIAAGGALSPRLLGEARAAGRIDAFTAKRVWHLLARFGRIDTA